MNTTLNASLPKSKEVAYNKKLDILLSQLRENNNATKEIYKDIDKLRKSNDRAFARAKRAVDALANY